jgi:hypothetical protein
MANDLVIKKPNEIELFELEQRKFQFMLEKAKFYATSEMVPPQYRTFIKKKVKNAKGYPEDQWVENPAAIGNCLIVMDLAKRIGISEMQCMQGIDVIEGRARPSATLAISAINACGRFSTLEYIEEDLGEKSVEYSEYSWQDGKKVEFKKKLTIRNKACTAVATELSTGKLLKSPTVTIELAVKEGWYVKAGSKWQTMEQLMLQKRSASWFANAYCPEVLNGMKTAEEIEDSEPIDLVQQDDGIYQVDDEQPKEESATEKIKEKIRKTREKKEQATEKIEQQEEPEVSADQEDKIPPVISDQQSSVIDSEFTDTSVDESINDFLFE